MERRQKRPSRDRVEELHDKGEACDSVDRVQRNRDVGGIVGVEGGRRGVQREGEDELRRLAHVVVYDGLHSRRELSQLARRGDEMELELIGCLEATERGVGEVKRPDGVPLVLDVR